MPVSYRLDHVPTVNQVIQLYHKAGLPRPLTDYNRMAALCQHTTLWVTAWDQDQLVGVARSLTDFRWCCYLADLAVRDDYQHQGIGRQLVEHTKQRVSEECMVLLLAVPTAMHYYPKLGMAPIGNGFSLARTS